VQQSTRYCGALPCRHLCMMTPSLYVTRSATSSQCKSSCKIWITCCRVSVTDSKYGVVLVNAGGHECVNKRSHWLRVKWSSDTSELTQPVKRCCGLIRHVTLQTQVRRVCHSEQTDVVLRRDGVCPELKRWTAVHHRGLTMSWSSPE